MPEKLADKLRDHARIALNIAEGRTPNMTGPIGLRMLADDLEKAADALDDRPKRRPAVFMGP